MMFSLPRGPRSNITLHLASHLLPVAGRQSLSPPALLSSIVGCVLISKGYLGRQGAWVKGPCTGALWCMCVSSRFFSHSSCRLPSHPFCLILSDLSLILSSACFSFSMLLKVCPPPCYHLQLWYFSIVCRLLAVRLYLNRLSDRLSDVSFKLYLYPSKNRQTLSPTRWPRVNSPAKIMKLDDISIFCQIKSLSFRGAQLYFNKQISTKEPDVRRKQNTFFEWLSPIQ